MSATEQGLNLTAREDARPTFTPGCSMKRICSWCGAFLGLITCTESQHGKVSHTVCPACKEKYNRQLDRAEVAA